MGSGTTGIACINTNREFIGMELDEGYFEIAKSRVEEHRGFKEEKRNDKEHQNVE
jgi:DNA modification methylase